MRLSEIITEVSERVWDLKDVVNYWVNNKTWIEISDRKVSEDTSTYKIIRKNYFAYNPYRVNIWSIGLFDWEIWAVSPAYVVFKVDEEKIIPKLLVRFLKSKKWIFEINKHTHWWVRKSLSIKDLWKIEINVPSIEVQKQFIEWWVKNRNLMDSLNLKTEENKELIKKLRQSILQDAIQWKLIEQNSNDEPASELLRKIKEEKEKLIKEKKIKKEKSLPPITDEEKPFDIPENWEWVRLGEIISLKSWADLKPGEYNSLWKWTVYLTWASNIGNNKLIINRRTEHPKNIAYAGSLILSCKGTIWKTYVLDIEKVHIARQFMAMVSIGFNIWYLQLFIKYYVWKLQSLAKSMIPWIERDNVLFAPIPLPPLEEQNKIVAKLNELIGVCDELEEKINSTGEEWEKLIDSVLQNIFRAS